ncbi:MAG: Gfo/Idh/MocA family oxidoreductase [Chloroflexi bacterium]|nr:Gfo/Idh/MocA family oxidoreductase [Chloroflexota bacterium]
MATRLNVALVGAGLMGSFHAETLAHRLPGARLAVIADADEPKTRSLIDQLGLDDTRYERDAQAAISSPDVQAVAIATPARFHADLIVMAAQAGKPSFTEKPLTHTVEEADRAIAAVAAAGTFLQVGFQRRFDRGFVRAKQAAEDGTLGQLHLLRSITRDPAVPRPEGPLPYAIFLETMIHDFDVLRWLAGSEPVEVSAMAGSIAWGADPASGALDTAVCTVRFANSALGTADVSFNGAFGYDVRAEVFGTGGMMAVGDGRQDAAELYTPSGVSRPHHSWFKPMFGDAYTAELAHFVECARTGHAPSVTGKDGRESLRMALAAIESVKTGRSVSLA